MISEIIILISIFLVGFWIQVKNDINAHDTNILIKQLILNIEFIKKIMLDMETKDLQRKTKNTLKSIKKSKKQR